MLRKLALVGVLTAMLLAATGGSALANYDYLLAPTTVCPGQNNLALSASTQEGIMRCMHNYARRKAGRAGLFSSGALATSSDGKTGDILRCQQFSHTACGRDFLYHFRRVGYTSSGCWGVGENIAWGSGSTASPRAIMRAWLNSTGHRDNILKGSFRDFGAGMRRGTLFGYRGVEVWTAHFGYRC